MSKVFVVSLEPCASYEFDANQFKETYPESMITATLNLTGERKIPLSNPIVTREILQILTEYMTTHDFPYIEPCHRKGLDYLGIDFPEFVYSPLYDSPDMPVVNSKTLDDQYPVLMKCAQFPVFPELITYLIRHSNHPETDRSLFNNLLNESLPVSRVKEEILIELIGHRGNVIGSDRSDSALTVMGILGYNKLFRIYEPYVKAYSRYTVHFVMTAIHQYPSRCASILDILMCLDGKREKHTRDYTQLLDMFRAIIKDEPIIDLPYDTIDAEMFTSLLHICLHLGRYNQFKYLCRLSDYDVRQGIIMFIDNLPDYPYLFTISVCQMLRECLEEWSFERLQDGLRDRGLYI